MLGEMDSFDFVLAEGLSMTIGELRERMSNEEYHQWRAFYIYRYEMAQLEAKKRKGGKT
jgi:hypothetical protein